MTENRALAVIEREDDGLSLVPTFAITLAQAGQQIKELQQFVKTLMVEGEDYGTIPGTPKPTLYKPGAEKLATVYGLTPTVEVTQRREDWTDGLFSYEVKVTLTSRRTGQVMAEGVGSCNSKERRYSRQDPFTLVNTILKMAKKRALVDAVLSATRTSGVFTQDVEDMAPEDRPVKPQPKPVRKQVLRPTRPTSRPPTQPMAQVNELTCEVCKRPITDYWIAQDGGKKVRYAAEVIAQRTEEKVGLMLCWHCYEDIKPEPNVVAGEVEGGEAVAEEGTEF